MSRNLSRQHSCDMMERPQLMDKSVWHESVAGQMKLSQSKADQAFESIFHKHWRAIHRLLARMVIDPAEAEDLALETFYRLYKYRPSQYETLNIRGWLYKVATNLALQSIRSFKRREQYEIHAGKDALIEANEDQPPKILAEKEEFTAGRIAHHAIFRHGVQGHCCSIEPVAYLHRTVARARRA